MIPPEYSPVQIENAIRRCASDITRSVEFCGELYSRFLDADREFDVAFARAYLNADGPAHARKYIATIRTEAERGTRDAADGAYQVANRRARSLEAELRALQSVGASVRQAYDVAGRGA